MRPPQPLPEPIRDRPFTVSEALALGMTREALRRHDLRVPHQGIRVAAHVPDTLLTRARAALLALPPGAVLSGPTAVELCGLPQPLHAAPVLSCPITAIVPPGSRPDVVGVETSQRDLPPRTRTVAGLPVVHPLHLWIDASQVLDLPDALALADAVRYRWASSAQMQAAVVERAGRRGVVRAREVLSLVRYRVESPMETRARLLFHAAGLPEPACGRDTTENGEWLARLDLSWPLVRVGTEIDGDHHRTDRRQWTKDIQGRRNLEAAGWLIIVLSADDILRRPEATVLLVARALSHRGLTW